MKLQKSQRGITVWGVSFILLLIGFVVFTVLKLLPVYMGGFSVESVVSGMEADQQAETFSSVSEVKNTVIKRLDMNNVKLVFREEDVMAIPKGEFYLSGDDIKVVKEGGFYLLDIDYEVRVPYIKNIDLVVNFSHTATVPAN